MVSARTGQGIDELRAVVESRLPRPEREVRALVPYERGDLINRIHQSGELLTSEHTEPAPGDRPGQSGPGRRAGPVRPRGTVLTLRPDTVHR